MPHISHAVTGQGIRHVTGPTAPGTLILGIFISQHRVALPTKETHGAFSSGISTHLSVMLLRQRCVNSGFSLLPPRHRRVSHSE